MKVKRGIRAIVIAIVISVCIVALSFYGVITSYVTSVPNYCVDSDGRNFFNAGKVELGLLMTELVTTEVHYDYCSDEKTLNEYYCAWENREFNYVVKKIQKTCEFGCSEGACMKPRVPKRENLFITIFKNMFQE